MMLILGLAMAVTQPWFSFLEDETTSAAAANSPTKEIMSRFIRGEGPSLHPPLSDLLLHYWLPVAGTRPWLLRLPSIFLFVAGLLILAAVATRLAGPSGWTAMLGIGLLWPFGFHFGRLIGWFSLSFFLLALLTWAYFRCLDHPSSPRWLAFFLTALALVYTNYFGWAIVGCLAADFGLRNRTRRVASLRPLLVSLLTLAIAYVPMGRALAAAILRGTHLGSPLLAKLVYAPYGLYSLFVSESIAPWFWALSIPAGAAIGVCLTLTVMLAPREVRCFLVYFALLLAAMLLLDVISTKRLLLVSPWLLLPVACAAAKGNRKGQQKILVLSMILIAAVGWLGVLSRRYYAAPHFLEPWAEVATAGARSIEQGAVVVTNSPSFLFYLNYSIEDTERSSGVKSDRFVPGWVEHPRVFDVEAWNNASHPTRPLVLFVRGVNSELVAQTQDTESWLRKNCNLQQEDKLVRDTGYVLKNRFFAGLDQSPFRITVQRYQCAP
jgi:hypothetical protein